MNRALVTSCGQDASYLAELLLNKGYEVHCMVRPIDLLDNIEHIKHKMHIYYGDLLSDVDFKVVLKKSDPQEVYNLAAISHVGFSFDEPVLTGHVTGLAVAKILDAIKRYNSSIRFLQASTSELYGNVTECPQNERTVMNPRSPYAAAKLYAYQMTKIYREAYNMFCCNSICFNHESPRRPVTFVTRKISYAAAQIKLGLKQDKLMLGTLDSQRDWGYSPEYVEAMWLMLQQPKADDYVIGTGEIHSVGEFVKEAFNHVGLDWKQWVEIDDKFKRPADVYLLMANCGYARSKLNWEPKVKFKELVKIMVDNDLKLLGGN